MFIFRMVEKDSSGARATRSCQSYADQMPMDLLLLGLGHTSLVPMEMSAGTMKCNCECPYFSS